MVPVLLACFSVSRRPACGSSGILQKLLRLLRDEGGRKGVLVGTSMGPGFTPLPGGPGARADVTRLSRELVLPRLRHVTADGRTVHNALTRRISVRLQIGRGLHQLQRRRLGQRLLLKLWCGLYGHRPAPANGRPEQERFDRFRRIHGISYRKQFTARLRTHLVAERLGGQNRQRSQFSGVSGHPGCCCRWTTRSCCLWYAMRRRKCPTLGVSTHETMCMVRGKRGLIAVHSRG